MNDVAKQNPNPTGLKDPIDLYIDSVRFIPDNATLIKVSECLLDIFFMEKSCVSFILKKAFENIVGKGENPGYQCRAKYPNVCIPVFTTPLTICEVKFIFTSPINHLPYQIMTSK